MTGSLLVADRAGGSLSSTRGLAEGPPGSAVRIALDGALDEVDGRPVELAEADAAALLLERFRRLGAGLLTGVDGRFALALYDQSSRTAIVARDAAGEHALAWTATGDRFAAATGERDLLASPGVSTALDSDRLALYFGSEELAGDATFYSALRAVLPGEQVTWTDGKLARRALGAPSLAARLELPRWEDYVELFAERLRGAVELRLAGATRVAVPLSGGLDSSPIAALAARKLGGANVVALHWRLAQSEADELALAEAVAARSGVELRLVPGDDALPFADLDSWPVHPTTPEQTAYRELHRRTYAAAAAAGCDTLLWGFGGDSLYGHARRWLFDLARAEGVGRAIDALRAAIAARGLRRVLRGELLAPWLRGAERVAPRGGAAWLTPEAAERLRRLPHWPVDLAAARRPAQALRLRALLDAHGCGVEASYAAEHGLRLHWPLRDRRLVEVALALPDHLLLRGAADRAVLRDATRDLLPEAVRTRCGKGNFAALALRGLAAARATWARPRLESPDALWRGFVRPAAIERWLTGPGATPGDELGFFLVLAAELWRERRAGAPSEPAVGDQ